MGKISNYGSDTSPTVNDYLLGNQASGPNTQRFLLSKIFSTFMGSTSVSANISSFANSGTLGGTISWVNLGGLKIALGTGMVTSSVSWRTVDWTTVGFSAIPYCFGSAIGLNSGGTAIGWLEFTSKSILGSGSPELNGASCLTRTSTTVTNSNADINILIIGT